MKQIVICFEGDARLKEGFRAFLNPEIDTCRKAKIRFELIACGKKHSRKVMENSKKDYPGASMFVLKDKEGPLNHQPEKQTYYMVQVMESWFAADPAAIKKAIGDCAQIQKFPVVSNVEVIPVKDIFKRMNDSTRGCGPEKHYDDKHPPLLASKILKALSRDKVEKKSAECRRFFAALAVSIHKLSVETK